MKRNYLKSLTAIIAFMLSCHSFMSCGGDAKTISDDKLAGYLLGGLYIFHSYGDNGNALVEQLKGYVPEGNGFTKRLHSAYNEIMINPLSEMDNSDLQSGLREWWEVNDKDELKAMIKSLHAGRHSVRFQKIYDAVKQAGGKSAAIEDVVVDDEHEESIRFVIDNYDVVQPTGIRAWDYARAANLIFAGQSLEWLTVAEGEALLAKLLATVRTHYPDWKTYHDDFKLGRCFWSDDAKEAAEYEVLMELLGSDNEYVIYNYLPLK